MAVHHGSVATSKHRDLETELSDTAAHAIHGRVVLAWVARIEDQPVNGPYQNLLCWRRCGHSGAILPPLDSSSRIQSSTETFIRWPEKANNLNLNLTEALILESQAVHCPTSRILSTESSSPA